MKKWLHRSFLGLRLVLRHAYYMFLYARKGKCKQCGRCCRRVYLRDRHSPISSFDRYLELIMSDKRYSRFKVKGQDEDGYLYFACRFVTQDNLCGDYKNRQLLCRSYPDVSIIKYGALPKEECGFYFINRITRKRVVY